MKRSKRFSIRRIALGLAVAAVIAPAAQAEPIGSYERESQSSVEIPYLSHGNVNVQPDFWNYDPTTGEKIADTSPGIGADQLAQLYSGLDVALGPDDLSLSRPSNAGSASVSSGSSWDVGPASVSGFAVALALLIAGSAVAIRHNRKTRLSPA
jgi:hypothetical protein